MRQCHMTNRYTNSTGTPGGDTSEGGRSSTRNKNTQRRIEGEAAFLEKRLNPTLGNNKNTPYFSCTEPIKLTVKRKETKETR